MNTESKAESQAVSAETLARICATAAEFYATLAKDLAKTDNAGRVADQFLRQAEEAGSIAASLEDHITLRVVDGRLVVVCNDPVDEKAPDEAAAIIGNTSLQTLLTAQAEQAPDDTPGAKP